MNKKAAKKAVSIRHPTAEDKHMGLRLRQRRLACNMSQEALGEQLGLTFQQVQKYEKGVNRISATRLTDIARILDVSVNYFYQGADTAGTSEPTAMDTFMASHDGLTIARAFVQIKNPRVRLIIARFVRAMSNVDDDVEMQAAE